MKASDRKSPKPAAQEPTKPTSSTSSTLPVNTDWREKTSNNLDKAIKHALANPRPTY